MDEKLLNRNKTMLNKIDKNEWKSDYILRELMEKYKSRTCNHATMQLCIHASPQSFTHASIQSCSNALILYDLT